MSDLDYMEISFPFEKINMELYNKIYEYAKIIAVEKLNYLKRSILYNAYKYLKDIMVTDIDGIKFYEDTNHIIINYKTFSLSNGIKNKEKILELELDY